MQSYGGNRQTQTLPVGVYIDTAPIKNSVVISDPIPNTSFFGPAVILAFIKNDSIQVYFGSSFL